MQYERVIDRALRNIQNLVWANLPDDRMVACLRAVVGAPEIQEALERGNDTALCFVLRAANRILSDGVQPRITITQLWELVDESELNHARSLKQNSRMMVWRKKPPAR
jgi:hypothetical protein